MKRLISAGVLFVLLVIMYLGALRTTDKICGKYKSMIEKCIDSIENGDVETADKYADKAEKYWDEKKEILAAFANHEPIDQIALANTEIKLRAKENEKGHLKTEAEKAFITLERIQEGLKVSAVLFY